MKPISHSVGMLISKIVVFGVTIWCALWSEKVLGSYFFENDNETTVTPNSERYGHMITDFFFVCKKVPHAIQLDRIWRNCKNNFLAV